MYAFHPLKLWSYWTKVHQILTRCSQIIADELFGIRMAILESVSKCQGYE